MSRAGSRVGECRAQQAIADRQRGARGGVVYRQPAISLLLATTGYTLMVNETIITKPKIESILKCASAIVQVRVPGDPAGWVVGHFENDNVA